jgi:hypothetical protein
MNAAFFPEFFLIYREPSKSCNRVTEPEPVHEKIGYKGAYIDVINVTSITNNYIKLHDNVINRESILDSKENTLNHRITSNKGSHVGNRSRPPSPDADTFNCPKCGAELREIYDNGFLIKYYKCSCGAMFRTDKYDFEQRLLPFLPYEIRAVCQDLIGRLRLVPDFYNSAEGGLR